MAGGDPEGTPENWPGWMRALMESTRAVKPERVHEQARLFEMAS
jgi:hypothetical protein